MKKSELEAKILELEKKIAVLESRPQTFCAGHVCNCHPYTPTTPYWPNTTPWYTGPTWTVTTMSGSVNSPGLPNGTVIN